MLSSLRVAWLNSIFWVLFFAVTAAFAVGSAIYIPVFHLCARNPRKTRWLLRRTISHYGSAIIKCAWPFVRVRYVDHAPHELPPFVFAVNHRSASDAFLMACLPFEVVQVVNLWPFRLPLLGPVARLAGYLNVRAMPVADFLDTGRRLLGEGVSIAAFPEGTRSGSRRMGTFHGTAFRLAQHAGVRVVPLAISGSENIPRRGSLRLRPGVIAVHKLPSISATEHGNMTPFALKNTVRDTLRRHLDAIEVPST